MLYPKEDRVNNRLLFACRTCQFSEEAASSCIFRNSIHNTIGATAGVTQDVGSDPTVGGFLCLHCGEIIERCGEQSNKGNEKDDQGKKEHKAGSKKT